MQRKALKIRLLINIHDKLHICIKLSCLSSCEDVGCSLLSKTTFLGGNEEVWWKTFHKSTLIQVELNGECQSLNVLSEFSTAVFSNTPLCVAVYTWSYGLASLQVLLQQYDTNFHVWPFKFRELLSVKNSTLISELNESFASRDSFRHYCRQTRQEGGHIEGVLFQKFITKLFAFANKQNFSILIINCLLFEIFIVTSMKLSLAKFHSPNFASNGVKMGLGRAI